MVTGTQLTEEATSHYIQAGGIKLHYNEAGSGGSTEIYSVRHAPSKTPLPGEH